MKQSPSMPINIQNRSGGMSPASRGSFSPPSNGYYYNGSVGSNSSDSGNGFIAGMEIEKDNGAIGAVCNNLFIKYLT
jgi:hypothetical protein